MLKPSDVVLDTTVSFDMHPVQHLGTAIKNAKVLSIVDARTAQQLGFDTLANHRIVYATLPPGVPNDHSKYHYLYLKLPSGQTQFIGLPWIKESTYTVEVIRNLRIELENITPEDQEHALRALSALGLKVANIAVF